LSTDATLDKSTTTILDNQCEQTSDVNRISNTVETVEVGIAC
jgi:hypothetical protein